MKKLFFVILLALSLFATSAAQEPDFVFGDPLPDAPVLAQRGSYSVGVRELSLTDAGRVDLLSATAENPSPLYIR